MPKLSQEFKDAITSLSEKEKEKIIFRFARKNQEIFDILNYEYAGGENKYDLFEDTKAEIESNFAVLSGRIIQKELAKKIGKSVQSINAFTKVTKDKKLEADLLLFLLKIVFENFSSDLGTCWTVFDSKTAITTNRLYNLVVKKLHYDYHIEYRQDINNFLQILKSKCRHLDYVYGMPAVLEG